MKATRTGTTRAWRCQALGLGTMGMTMAYGAIRRGGGDRDDAASELGITSLDTAELYGNGTGSDGKLVGEAVAPFRDEVVIATSSAST